MVDSARSTDFPHLQLPTRISGKAKLPGGGGGDSERTVQNRANRQGHSSHLSRATDVAVAEWQKAQAEREKLGLPVTPGMPVLLQIDPALDLDSLKSQLGFEIVSEHDDGFVIVASGDAHLEELRLKIQGFADGVKGSGAVASVHEIYGAGTQERIEAISEWLAQEWPLLRDEAEYVVDVGIECVGTQEFSAKPTISPRKAQESDARWSRRQAQYQTKLAEWSKKRDAVYIAWDELKDAREAEIRQLVEVSYGGEILKTADDAGVLDGPPDSFTVRVRVSGKGLKDLVLNYKYVFEVVEPDDIVLPQHEFQVEAGAGEPTMESPAADAVTVGVIDSGIQEAHKWISAAIDQNCSTCLVPNETAVADLVSPNGHGTRVAGAVLFGETVPKTGAHKLPFWLRNVRVLDANNKMPPNLVPGLATRTAIQKLRERGTRIFNQSINAHQPCRTRHMSSWAAEIDSMSNEYDILVVQSAGNIRLKRNTSDPGIEGHLAQGRAYPHYLREPACRIANPAQSLQALTVGSVAYGLYEADGWKSFASRRGEPSAFSRGGPSIWDVIKPEVVEFGGDLLRIDGDSGVEVATPSHARECYPELIRSTLHQVGQGADRDQVGTSFAAPKVTHIVAHVESQLPEQPCLLYRALVAQSARWPEWALTAVREYQEQKRTNQRQRAGARGAAKRAAKRGKPAPAAVIVDDSRERELADDLTHLVQRIGYGIPDVLRATENSPHRVTLITSGEKSITAGACDIYEVRVPPSMRAVGNDYDVLVEVTLSYVASPRRTRRTTKRYLSVWMDWITNASGETIRQFEERALKADTVAAEVEADDEDGSAKRAGIPWTLGAQADHGILRKVSRNSGTLQKDWAIMKMYNLPESFCIAVRGHKGWSNDPDARARYAMTISFDVLGQEVEIYEDVRIELESEVRLGGGLEG